MAEATATATAAKFVPTTEGLICAYSSIMVMALVPIYYGSFKSIKHQTDSHARFLETGEQAETMTSKDAFYFPVIASCALLSLYILIKLFPDMVNLFVSGYFFFLGIVAFYRLIKPSVHRLIPKKLNSTQYTFSFSSRDLSLTTRQQNREGVESPEGSNSSGEDIPNNNTIIYAIFSHSDILSFLIALALGVWYVLTKHWVANNAFGLAFALNGIELLPINSFKVGFTLLSGLFFYDVFWVFGTDVMVSVAKKFDAPIKVVSPQDFLTDGFWGKHLAMLGLGDIVIPGIFIAFLLRFDHSLKKKRNTYFWSCFIAYISGLVLTIGVMTYFKHAQPALLYLVPLCLFIPTFVALINGEFKALLQYRDHPNPSEDDEASASSEEDNNSEPQTKKPTGSIRTRSSSKKHE